MRKAHMLVGLLVVLSLLPALVYGLHDVRVPPYIVNSTFLNNYTVGYTLANGARRDSAAVYVLQRGVTYLS